MIYQYFGSEDSRDIDVVFFPETMPDSLQQRSALCKELTGAHFGPDREGRAVNANLAILDQGVVVQVYKGTPDELNNALYATYPLHRQDFPNQIQRPLPRNTDLKVIRGTRMMLSALSRTIYRPSVKLALQGDLRLRLETLKTIDLNRITTTGKGFDLTDIRKLLAFQLGQTLALVSGRECYTKNSIIACYPELAVYLRRQAPPGNGPLMVLLAEWITMLEKRISLMKYTEEHHDPLNG